MDRGVRLKFRRRFEIGGGRFSEMPRSTRLRRITRATIVALANLAEHHDPYIGQHLVRVSHLSDDILSILQRRNPGDGATDRQFREDLRIASMLHDIGKVAIPDGILTKPGRLDEAERALVRKHSDDGRRILHRAARGAGVGGFLDMGAEVAGYHHERFDGTGYPYGLKGEEIPLSARIVAVADVFDALTHKRSYKSGWSQSDALAYLRDGAGTEFDPAVVSALEEALGERAATAVVAWDDSMSVGVEELDEDHRALIDIINLVAAGRARGDWVTMEFVLDELSDYTVFHFEREERLMAEAGYPDLDAHVARHVDMTARIEGERYRFLHGLGAAIGDELLEYLGAWLRNHILAEDMRYAPFLKPKT